MHPLLVNLASMTPAQAAEILTAVRIKAAAAVSQQKQADDTLRNMAIGGAAGAGLLGLHGLMRGKRRKGIARSALAGALVGGGLGAGFSQAPAIYKALSSDIATPQERLDNYNNMDYLSRMGAQVAGVAPKGAKPAVQDTAEYATSGVKSLAGGAASYPGYTAAAVLPTAASEIHRHALNNRLKQVNQVREGLSALAARHEVSDPLKAREYHAANADLRAKFKIDPVNGPSRFQNPWGTKFVHFDMDRTNNPMFQSAIDEATHMANTVKDYKPPIGLKPGRFTRYTGGLGRGLGKAVAGPLIWQGIKSLSGY